MSQRSHVVAGELYSPNVSAGLLSRHVAADPWPANVNAGPWSAKTKHAKGVRGLSPLKMEENYE